MTSDQWDTLDNMEHCSSCEGTIGGQAWLPLFKTTSLDVPCANKRRSTPTQPSLHSCPYQQRKVPDPSKWLRSTSSQTYHHSLTSGAGPLTLLWSWQTMTLRKGWFFLPVQRPSMPWKRQFSTTKALSDDLVHRPALSLTVVLNFPPRSSKNWPDSATPNRP